MYNMLARSGNRWTVNELLALQREYELLGWDVERIATKHGRSVNAIMYKLDQEGIASFNELYQQNVNMNLEEEEESECDSDSESESDCVSDEDSYVSVEQNYNSFKENDALSTRVKMLEENINLINYRLEKISESLIFLTRNGIRNNSNGFATKKSKY